MLCGWYLSRVVVVPRPSPPAPEGWDKDLGSMNTSHHSTQQGSASLHTLLSYNHHAYTLHSDSLVINTVGISLPLLLLVLVPRPRPRRVGIRTSQQHTHLGTIMLIISTLRCSRYFTLLALLLLVLLGSCRWPVLLYFIPIDVLAPSPPAPEGWDKDITTTTA